MTDNLLNNTQNPDNYTDQDDGGINLSELIATLFDSKWLIISITTLALMIGIAKALVDTPIYIADAMLQVEESSQSLGALEPVAGLFESKTPIQAEIEIIKSRMVLGQAVANLNLETIALPNHFPFIGKAIARRFQASNKNKVSEPWLGYTHYAWGGEKIKADSLTVPTSWIGKNITLISDKKGQFTLLENNNELAKGEVGKAINIKIKGEEAPFSLFISVLTARPGTHFTLTKQSKILAISALQHSLSVAEKGKGSGILKFTMQMPSPPLAMQILNEISNIYIQFNVEKKSAEAQKTLEFLDTQLPKIKNQLELATTALNEYRLEKGSIDLTIETQAVLSGVVENRTQITVLQQKRDGLRGSFTPSHPNIIAIDKQIRRLQALINNHNKKIEELPETQQAILRLSRDVQVNSQLYITLLNNSQTLKVAKAGTVGDVRVIDYAVLPTTPIKPKKKLIVAIALILGLIIGVALAFIRKVLNHGIDDPELIEKNLNVPVYATVPHSPLQKKLHDQLKNNKTQNNDVAILAVENDEDLAIESLRSLRTTLHFAFLEAKNNVIMITGPSPGVGKSFISTNLAVVLANSGKKVLLIDADLRKGFMNKVLGVSRNNGLSELISNAINSETAIKTIAQCNIDFIPTGAIPPNPSELLLHERFSTLLETLSQQYDQIIIDSPPILAVTDACIIGRSASATLMVVKAGEHSLRELQQSVKRLKQNNVDVKGFIFNDMSISSSRYGYGYGYGYGKYVYQYNYQK